MDSGHFILVENKIEGSEPLMIVMERETFKNIISYDLFTVKNFDDSRTVILEAQNGYSRIWLQKADVESFFEKKEYQGGKVR